MSKKSLLLGVAVTNMVKELANHMPQDKIENMESKIQSDLAKKLGTRWTDLPASGPYMVIVFMAMNMILVPLGISPSAVADTMIAKGKEWELDDKASKVISSVKSGIKNTGEFSNEKFNEISVYIKENSKDINITEKFKEEMDEASKLMKDGLKKGKSFVGKIFSRKSKDEKEEN